MQKPHKHLKKEKLLTDVNQLAYYLVNKSTEENPSQPQTVEPQRSPISEYLAQIGRKGGLKGGKARAEKLSARKRKEIAKKAAETRWSKPH